MAVVALLEAEEVLGVSGVVISSFFGIAVGLGCVVVAVVLGELVTTFEGHEFESVFSSSTCTSS